MFHYCLDGDIKGVKKYIADVKDINWRNEDFDDEEVSTYRFQKYQNSCVSNCQYSVSMG